jgi:hypothetical protein
VGRLEGAGPRSRRCYVLNGEFWAASPPGQVPLPLLVVHGVTAADRGDRNHEVRARPRPP